jgi:hypothetical protein
MDLEPARACGMQALLVDRSAADGTPSTIRSLGEIAGRLAAS